ncbi:MAG: hypothetical protein ACR2NH_03500 [Solirubrobacteraceae bacterium]
MAMPGCAPSLPASNEPPRLTTLPFSYSAVASPRYQMFPSESWAYQSSVTSTGAPRSVTTSRTTRATIPLAMVFVRSVTVMLTVCRVPAVSVSR